MGPYGYTGTIQTVTVGTTGTFQITGYGARGGKNGQYLGGNGAEEGGTFNLTAGEQLEIVVGGAGANGGYAGGGGGSFVLANIGTNHAFVPLVVAGGGGGAGSGAGGAGGGAAGNGYGGSASYIDGGGNGAGVKSNGAHAANGGYGGGGGYNGSAANGSNAYHGGTGYGPNGGFGGGGSGGSYGGGGGGGYSGGGGGYGGGGGGGTSYVASLASAPFNGDAGTENAANGGNGEVIITPNAVCYVSGTLIRTARGDVAVEDLVVGDLAATASGVHRPIRWLGHRILRHSGAPQASPEPGCFTMSGLERVQTIPAPAHPGSGFELRPPRNDGGLTPDAWPIRISAHAFGPNRPARDLYVSPGHSICVTMIEEVLIPASALVNGTTIQQVEVDEVTYWHVELDSHDILLAENLPAESYIEMGNRNFFREADVVSLDALPDATLDARTHADFCRPFHSEGPIVEAARSHLRARRAAIGWTLTHDPMADLHLVADGKRIEPAIRDLTARFSVPAGAKNVWLVSNTSRPCDVADSVDGRELGVYLTGLTIDDGFDAGRPIALADPLLCVGFHEVEEGVRRWTAGRARLPAALWEACPEGFFLRLDCVQPALPRWVAPAEAMTIRTAA